MFKLGDVIRSRLTDQEYKIINETFFDKINKIQYEIRELEGDYSFEIMEDKLEKQFVKSEGIKHDSEKLRWSLLPFSVMKEVIEVLMYGSEKYADNNWKKVENHRERYFNASMRHILTWWEGEKLDEETNKHHLAHAICCLIYLIWFDKEVEK